MKLFKEKAKSDLGSIDHGSYNVFVQTGEVKRCRLQQKP